MSENPAGLQKALKKANMVLGTYQQKLADADMTIASMRADYELLAEEHQEILTQLARLQEQQMDVEEGTTEDGGPVPPPDEPLEGEVLDSPSIKEPATKQKR